MRRSLAMWTSITLFGWRQAIDLVPDVLCQQSSRDDLTLAAEQVLQDVEFPGGQVDRVARARHLSRDAIQFQIRNLHARDLAGLTSTKQAPGDGRGVSSKAKGLRR